VADQGVRRFRPNLAGGAAKLWPLAGLAALLVAIVGVASAAPESYQRTVTSTLINLIVVVGLYVFVGNSGVLSFGHASFMAIGAYASALVTVPLALKHALLPDLPGFLADAHMTTIPAVLVAAAAAAVFSVLIGVPLMRLSGLAAGIATFAVLVIVNVVISQWDALTRGYQSMTGVPTDTTMFGALAWALVAMTCAYTFQESTLGLRLRASREDEVAARSVGVSVVFERTIAFALSAAVVAIGGALYGHFQGTFFPDDFYFAITAITFAMLVIGGITSLAGAVVGTVVVSAIAEGLRHVEQGFDVGGAHVPGRAGLQEVVLALLMLVILVLRPRGITGGRELGVPRFRSRPPKVPLEP
jgi:branched-chain amino acid transport system permease protein